MKKVIKVIPKPVIPVGIPDRVVGELTSDEIAYLDSLDTKEKQAYEIAKSHLGTTFHLMKSNGFIKWQKAAK